MTYTKSCTHSGITYSIEVITKNAVEPSPDNDPFKASFTNKITVTFPDKIPYIKGGIIDDDIPTVTTDLIEEINEYIDREAALADYLLGAGFIETRPVP